jgi:hypothetical protein
MASFAKHVDSKERRRIQRMVDELPAFKGTVTQKVGEKGSVYLFTGTIKGRPREGLLLGNNHVDARGELARFAK